MKHHLLYRCVLLLAPLLALLPARAGLAWGDDTHEAIARGAAVMVAEPMRPFFLANTPFLAAHSTDPDYIPNRTQAQKAEHFLDLDLFGKPPFAALPHDRKAAETKFGADVMAQRGLLPWAIEREYGRLVAALQKKDWAQARLAAAHLAHFVSDATMPLHATANYDGQDTGNKGINVRVEIEMVSRFHSSSCITAGTLIEIKDPVEWSFQTIADSLAHCESLLRADTAARKAAPLDSELYYAELNRGCGDILRQRTELAATALASFWTAAWKQAGSPTLPVDTALIVIAPSRFATRGMSAERAASLNVSADHLAALLKPSDAVAWCGTGAPVYLRNFTLQFTTARDSVELGNPVLAHRFSGDLRDALGTALRALDQFPASRRIILLVSDGWKPDPAVLDQARLMKEKGIRGLFLVKGPTESSTQAEDLAAQSGGKLVRLADDVSADKAVRENLPAMTAREPGRR